MGNGPARVQLDGEAPRRDGRERLQKTLVASEPALLNEGHERLGALYTLVSSTEGAS